MTQWSPEHFTKAQLAGIEALVGLTGKAFECFQHVTELNLQTMKATLAETQEGLEKVLSVSNPQDLLALQMESIPPATERALAYRRQLIEILAATRTEFDKVGEVQYTAGKQGLHDFIASVTSKTQAGPTAPLAAWQEALNATTMFYESLHATAKQAAQAAESSFNTVSQAASPGARRRTAQHSQAAAK
ncbi:phasin family protein [Cupriavidus necator]|uniref:phasin family protein n=1 Tax=Cupriavidus necator TaxID=106590 RepID=UPI001490712E|nr:phasin family protein [Cupriavidus necator]NOV26781.1 phasin family protein [Cupriavidus necator]